MELECNMTIQIGIAEDAPAEHLLIECFDANGNEVRLQPQPPLDATATVGHIDRNGP